MTRREPKSKPEIVKVQLPVIGQADLMLVYAEGGDRTCQTVAPRRIIKTMGDDKRHSSTPNGRATNGKSTPHGGHHGRCGN